MKDYFRGLFILSSLFAVTTPAFAYIGPGSGLSVVGTIIALIGALFMMIVGFFWYPIKRMLNKKQNADTVEIKADAENDLENTEIKNNQSGNTDIQ